MDTIQEKVHNYEEEKNNIVKILSSEKRSTMRKKILYTVVIIFFLLPLGCNDINEVDIENKSDISKDISESTIHLSYLTGSNAKLLKFYEDIVIDLNILSVEELGIFLDVIYLPAGMESAEYFEKNFSAGMLPDIMQVAEFYPSLISKNASRVDLYHYVNKGYAVEITDYINEKTPYISSFYNSYPDFRKLSSVEDKIYGVILYDNITTSIPRMIVKNSLCEELDIKSVSSFDEAFEEFFRMDKFNLSEKLFIDGRLIMNSIIDKSGYYNLIASLPYIYLSSKNDYSCKVVRIEDTDILDQAIWIKQQLNNSNIGTSYEELNDFMKNPNMFDAVIIGANYDFNYYIANEYKSFYLLDEPLERRNMQPQFPYFFVSETCANKQDALIYIDWLHTNIDARKLVTFGKENVNYKYDQINKYIYWDDSVTSAPFMFLGGGDSISTVTDQIFGGSTNKTFIKTNLIKEYTLNPLSYKLLSRSDNISIYFEKMNLLFRQFEKQYRLENTELFKMNNMYSLFFNKISIEEMEEYKNLLKESRNQDFVDSIQEIFNSLE